MIDGWCQVTEFLGFSILTDFAINISYLKKGHLEVTPGCF